MWDTYTFDFHYKCDTETFNQSIIILALVCYGRKAFSRTVTGFLGKFKFVAIQIRTLHMSPNTVVFPQNKAAFSSIYLLQDHGSSAHLVFQIHNVLIGLTSICKYKNT